MPELKSRYLETHKRDICPSCRFWIPWYRNKRGEKVYGCRLGLIPENRDGQSYCPDRKAKRLRRRVSE